MALLLRPGDPLPTLRLTTGKLDPAAHAGHYWAIATGPHAALQRLTPTELPLVVTTPDVDGLAASQRLGATSQHGEPEPLVVLVDPAGTVVQSWADAPLADLLRQAQAKAQELART